MKGKEPHNGYLSRNLVAQQFLIKQRKVLVVTGFFSEELKYVPCGILLFVM
jgi:hypothetical protein